MSEERLVLLEKYLKSGISPILIQNVSSTLFENAVIIKSNVDKSELNGHYEGIDFQPPVWYKQLLEKCKKGLTFLLIENINEIDEQQQAKFIEILKYKKVSTFELPENCMIIVTCLNKNKINEEVYSLLVHI